jgi:hypothetical protein
MGRREMARFRIVLLTVVIFAFMMNSAQAIGLGLYGTWQVGPTDWEFDDTDDSGFIFDYSGDTSRVGGGFVLDTAVAKDKLFNYRLNIGVETFVSDLDELAVEMDLSGVAIDNTFGFGVMRGDTVRLWLGPRLRLGFFDGDVQPEIAPNTDIYLLEVGLGGVFGANFNIGSTVTLGLTTGYMYSGYGGIVEGVSDEDVTLTGDGGRVFLSGVLIFRMGADRN